MNDDDHEIMCEIYAYREAFAAAHNYDIGAMLATLRAKAEASGEKTVRLPPRPVELVAVAQKPVVEPESQLPSDRVA